MSPNLAHLRTYVEQLLRLGLLAQCYFPEDPNKALLKLRQLGELLAQLVACRFGVELRLEETQQQLVQRLVFDGILDREVAELFHVLRRKGNKANHELQGDHATTLKTLRFAWQLGVCFHRSFGDPQFRSGPAARGPRFRRCRGGSGAAGGVGAAAPEPGGVPGRAGAGGAAAGIASPSSCRTAAPSAKMTCWRPPSWSRGGPSGSCSWNCRPAPSARGWRRGSGCWWRGLFAQGLDPSAQRQDQPA